MNYEIYDINDTSLLVGKTDLSQIVTKIEYQKGFFLCNHNELYTNISNIARANSEEFIKNGETLFNMITRHDELDTVILAEGEDSNLDSYFQRVNRDEVMKFDSYSSYLREEIYQIKIKLWTEVLYSSFNLNNWYRTYNMTMPEYNIDQFLDNIVKTKDFASYLDTLDENILDLYGSKMRELSKILINKYRSEIIEHYNNIVLSNEKIILVNPIILDIYMSYSYVREFNKTFPNINVKGIAKKSLSLLGISL
jgi:hypothetical protein